MWCLILACVAAKTQSVEGLPVENPPAEDLPAEDLPAEAAPTHPEPAATGPVSVGEFGWSFVYGSTLSGRTVFLVEFGAEMPTFGHHGEPFGAEPSMRAWDTVSGESSEIQDLIAMSADRRHALVQDFGGIWLVDPEGQWQKLDPITEQGDGNRCLPPRQAAFSPDGSKVGWINVENSALRVRDLESGEEWEVGSQDTLWRGWPDNQGQGANLLELQEESEKWPLQGTSCACRWCGMFAMSYGVYGWSGPAFAMAHVDGDGERGASIEEEGGGPMHGPNAQGCVLESASPIKEALQHGPWSWVCEE